MARNQYNFAKRQREIEKKKKKEAKEARKQEKKDSSSDDNSDAPAVEGGIETEDGGQI